MAPFQLRVRTLYPRTQPVPFTPLSIRLGPPPPSDVHPGEVRTQHVGATTLPRAQGDAATSQDTGNAASRAHTPPGRSASPLARERLHPRTRTRPHVPQDTPQPSLPNVDVKVSSSQLDRPITPVGLRWRPAPDQGSPTSPYALPPIRSGQNHTTCPPTAPKAIPRSLNSSITRVVTTESLPLDGVTSISCVII